MKQNFIIVSLIFYILYLKSMTQREKFKIKVDIKTFWIIFSTVASISFWWASIVNKLDNVAIAQARQWEVIEQLIAKRDADHKIIDQQIARLDPTVRMILRKLWL